MLIACHPLRTQESGLVLLAVLLVALSFSGCAGLTSANNPENNPKGNGSSAAPSITTQPVSADVTAGNKQRSFSVAVTGTAPFSYQWQKNGSAISGATSSAYTTAPTTAADNRALFTVVVSNSAGSATSNAATLNVTAAAGTAPSITTQPVSASVSAGQTATFSVAVTGTAPVSLSVAEEWNGSQRRYFFGLHDSAHDSCRQPCVVPSSCKQQRRHRDQ